MPSTTSKNLGQVSAVFKGAVPPTNLDLIWLDTSVSPAQKKVWDPTIGQWILLGNTTPVGDNWGTQVVVSSEELDGNGTVSDVLKIAQQGATTGQVLKWDGTKWAPANDLMGGGISSVVSSDEFEGNGTVASPLKLAQNGAQDKYVLTWDGTISKYRPKALPEFAKFEAGMIMMWAGAVNSLPTGWALCDGQSGRPNLKGLFIVGYDAGNADYNAIGKTGGLKEVSLTADQNGPHNHSITDPGHSHSYTRTDPSSHPSGTATTSPRNNATAQTSTAYTGISINNSGLGAPHENRPPYYVLAYIIKL